MRPTTAHDNDVQITLRQPAFRATAPMMVDQHLAQLRAYRNNILRYRNLLATRLTNLERRYIERRLQEEQSAMDDLSHEAFPLGQPKLQSLPEATV